jgi:secreted trypsin-like serine protease
MPMTRFLFCILISLSAIQCFPNSTNNNLENTSSQIVNGVEPINSVKKHTVLLRGTASYCSGVLVGPTKVLSAAHCFRSSPLQAIVFTQRADFLDPKKECPATTFHRLQKDNSIDIAIASFDCSKNRKAQKDFEPVSLVSQYTPAQNDKVLLAGFGKEGTNVKTKFKLLQAKSKVNFWKQDYSFVRAQSETNQGTCQGDSGGPVFQSSLGPNSNDFSKLLLIGIVSGGSETCENGDTWFTNLGSARLQEFLNKNL